MKERMKKSFAMLLCVLMCLSLLPEVHVHAEDAAGEETVIAADTQGEEETTAAPEEIETSEEQNVKLALSNGDDSIVSPCAYENTYTNTGNYAADIVGVAKTQIGYTENSDGTTKYGIWAGNSTGGWCGFFVTWCANQAGIPNEIVISSNTDSNRGSPAYMVNSYSAGEHKGTYYPYSSSSVKNIQPGDILLVNPSSPSGAASHVGIVSSVNSSTGDIRTIEGNMSSPAVVKEARYNMNNSYGYVSGWAYIIGHYHPDYSANSDYLSQCTPYPAGGVIQMTTSAWLWSLPCSDETDSSSVHVSSEKIASGTYLNVTGLYKNVTNDTTPHYWYRLTWDGQTAYVYAPYTTFVGIDNSSITVTDIDNPSSLTVGDRFWIKGVISSPYLLLTNVTAYVLNSSGGVVLSSPDNPNSHSYSLYKSTVDDNLTFNTLSAGTYRYFVGLTIQGYYVDSSNALKTTSSDIVANGLDTYFTVSEAGHTHSYTTTVVAPTCTEAGYTLHSCSCGYSYRDNTVAAKGHSYGSTVTKQATCTEAGIKTYTCNVCGDSYTESIAALGHSYTSQTIEGSCTQRPSVKYTCTRCGDTYTEYADGNWSEWSTTKPSGVPESAIQTKTQYRYRDKETTTSSSSTLDGWTLSGSETVWSDYGAWSDWSRTYVAASDSTQVETAPLYRYYYFLCHGCGDHNPLSSACGCGSTSNSWVQRDSTIPYNQSNSSAVSYATYKRQTTSLGDGQLWYFSSGNLNDTAIGTVDSDSSETVINQGYRYRTRTQSTVYNFYRWADWSSWSDTAVTASDSREVETRQMYRYDLYATAEHSWDSGVVTTAAGCETEGVMTYTCTACGETRTETIPATGHSWGEWVVTKEPTLTIDGVETRTCQACGKTETRSVAAVIYTVSYNANGGSGAPASQQKLKGAALTLSSTKPTRSGYTFLGWAASSTATAAQYQPGGSYTADKDITLYAVWKKAGVEKGQLTVSTPQARPGETVAVDVSIAENPGICAFAVQVDYDDTVLELISIEHPEIGTDSIWNIYGGVVSWISNSDTDYNGTLFTVTFKVADDAEDGTAAVTVLYESGNIGNYAEEEINPSVQAGGVNIVSRIPSDTNGDGMVNTMDLIRLMKSINGEEVDMAEGAGDVNGDGKINTMDLIRLMKYINGEDVELQ